ncbi:MAG: uracil-DNA glycosylase family protein [Stappiaceae bacterium]
MDSAVSQLCGQIRACTICRDTPRKIPLPHAPRPVIRATSTARLCIAGQAPGTRVHASGLPFDDPSGERLRDWMAIDRSAFYDERRLAIVPMGFCFPGLDAKGGDLPPRTECRDTWHDQVFAAMPQLELILVIGQYAQAYHLGKARKKSLTETVKNWETYWHSDETGCRYLPLPHPSWRNTGWLKKNPWFAEDVLPVLRSEVARLIS